VLIAGSSSAAPAVYGTYLKIAQPIVITAKPNIQEDNEQNELVARALGDTNHTLKSVYLILGDTNRTFKIALRMISPDVQFVPISLDTNQVYTFTIQQRPHRDFTVPQLRKVQLDGRTIYDIEVCEIHNAKMDFKEVPIGYGLPGPDPDGLTYQIERRLFPHRRERVNGGCCFSDISPKTEKIYVCADCKQAYEKWKVERHKP
jgi:hypothetical protein